MAVFEIEIAGPPKAQKRHKFGRGYVYDPSKLDKKKVIPIVQSVLKDYITVHDCVHISFSFYMPIPKSWPIKKKVLLQDETVDHIKTPDIDNMIKFYMDVLPFNDKQVSRIKGAFKVYSPEPRVHLVLEAYGQLESVE